MLLLWRAKSKSLTVVQWLMSMTASSLPPGLAVAGTVGAATDDAPVVCGRLTQPTIGAAARLASPTITPLRVNILEHHFLLSAQQGRGIYPWSIHQNG
jgi:hypothetical protein